MNDLFDKAPVRKAYMQLALPVVLGMVASMVYNLADTFFVAKTGNANLVAGIAIGAPLFSFMLAVGDIFGLGGSAVISRLMGQQNHRTAAELSAFCFYAAIAFSVVLTAVMLVFERPLLHLMGATSATYPYAADFYRMLALGAVFIIVSLVPGNIIRTEGLAKQSMIATLAGTALTIVLDPIFLFGLHWGAMGVGFANVLGYVVNTSLLVWFMHSKARVLTLNVRQVHATRSALWAVVSIGIPASLTNFMQSFGMMLLNNYLARFGADAVAAMGIAQKIYMVVMLIMVGFAFGAQPLIGYCYGAKNWSRLRAVLRFDFEVEVGYALVAGAVIMLLAKPLVAAFMSAPEIVTMGTLMLRALLLTTPLIGAILVFTTVFQSTGKPLPALLMAISRQGVLFAAALIALAAAFGFTGVVWAQPVADALTFALGLVLYRRSFDLAALEKDGRAA
ncbi:MATE family efflux transporter [Lacticaseibacillus mingshuiensis]|uniref:Multidrug export protein MepA n=1 Tax=Lacticaseibacillus mingshuiensis TaxID=2799574 RepID=A0ABW4CK15_9LACO|nr:MATE family efflux transporter [Lacticaseibacillus mingshuiensis]